MASLEEEGAGLRGLLTDFESRCFSARKEPLAGHPVAALMRKFIASEVERSGIFENGRYKASGSVEKEGWAEIPWMAVYGLSETDTLHHGLFIVYVFSADMSSLFLALDQECSTYYETHTRADTDERARRIADELERHVDGRGAAPGPITLGASSSTGRFLENGCVYSVRYDTGSLPDEGRLMDDLRTFKALYEDALTSMRELGM